MVSIEIIKETIPSILKSIPFILDTLYSNSVYFSSRAQYSHSYAVPNEHGERCIFFARVLIGSTIVGDTTMKVCPLNYHSTTDGEYIYVVFHDAQAHSQYLIRYQ
jgi:hypothetical protein